jgi:Fe2+ transport system protein FeoA
VEIGESVVVRRVSDRNGDFLRQLASLELVPGTRVRVVGREAAGGAITLELDGRPLSVGELLARRVYVD